MFVVDLLNHPYPTSELDGSVDMIGLFSVLHFFKHDHQIDILKRLIGFARPTPGSAVLGRQIGSLAPSTYSGLMKEPRTISMTWRASKTSGERRGETIIPNGIWTFI